MPPLVSQSTTRSAPASSAVRTTEAAYAGSKRKPSKKCSQSTKTRRPSRDEVARRCRRPSPGSPSAVVRSARSTCRRSDLATRQTAGGLGVEQRLDLRVVGDGDAGLAGGAERDEHGVPQLQLGAGPAEELGVLGHRARPAALDEADAELVEQPGDGELVGDRVADPLALRAVAQSGVVDLEVHRGSFREQQKTSRRMREVCALGGGEAGALTENNEVERGHALHSATPGPVVWPRSRFRETLPTADPRKRSSGANARSSAGSGGDVSAVDAVRIRIWMIGDAGGGVGIAGTEEPSPSDLTVEKRSDSHDWARSSNDARRHRADHAR